jgi:hypothetical protein
MRRTASPISPVATSAPSSSRIRTSSGGMGWPTDPIRFSASPLGMEQKAGPASVIP